MDTVLMGASTYRQVAYELSPDAWPYAEQRTYVLSRHPESLQALTVPTGGRLVDEPVRAGDVAVTNANPSQLVVALAARPGERIWIRGGANVAQQLLAEDLVDDLELSIVPVVLGRGIRLFSDDAPRVPLALAAVGSENGIVSLSYCRKPDGDA